MLVSPVSPSAASPTLWAKLKKKPNNKNVMAGTRMLTLACNGKETLQILPPTYDDLETVARNWAQPAPNAPFALRVPVEFASIQAARFIQGDFIYLHDEQSYQITIAGIHGLYVEVVSETPPPVEPPPPPPPPVLEMPAEFKLELAPGQVVAIDTICESDELDMSRTEDGTLVAGMFMGKLDIMHDFDAKVHRMEFTGTRLKAEEYSPDFFFDSRTMGKLTIAAKPPVAKCTISVYSPQQQYCDVTLTFSPLWKLGFTWPPAEHLSDDKAKFFLRVNPGGALEHFEAETVVSSLYYEAIPEPAAVNPSAMVEPQYSFAMPTSQFIPHISRVLEELGFSVPARTSFMSNQLSSFLLHRNIAYRFMPPHRLGAAIGLDVTVSPCVWTRIFLLYRGISDDELATFVGRGPQDLPQGHWRAVVNWTEDSTKKEFFRVLESSVLELN